MKEFFGIKGRYRFEYNDLRAFITVLNVILIMKFGLIAAWFGLAVDLFDLGKDLLNNRRINGLMMNLSSIVLNLFFISQI